MARKKCETCGSKLFHAHGTKEQRIKFYVDSAMRLGACFGQWSDGGDGVINSLASQIMGEAIKGLTKHIAGIANETTKEQRAPVLDYVRSYVEQNGLGHPIGQVAAFVESYAGEHFTIQELWEAIETVTKEKAQHDQNA